jgi:hypothetical protein
VFSQEYTEGCDKQAEKSGNVSATREKLLVSGTAETADTRSARKERVDCIPKDKRMNGEGAAAKLQWNLLYNARHSTNVCVHTDAGRAAIDDRMLHHGDRYGVIDNGHAQDMRDLDS